MNTPLLPDVIRTLHAGDRVLLSGALYTARDAAHARMIAALDAGEPLPIPPGEVVYYAGPCPAKLRPDGTLPPIGSIGPTTSSRMDAFSPRLIAAGLTAMVGKGDRSAAVVDAIKAHGGVYFAAVGGAAALLAKCVTACEIIAYADLGTEAVRKLTVKDFPLFVAIDSEGKSMYR